MVHHYSEQPRGSSSCLHLPEKSPEKNRADALRRFT